MNYKLSPSDLTFSYEGCKRCFYQKVVNNITQPSIPLPSIFSKIAGLLKNHYDGKPTSELHINLPHGIVSHGEEWVRGDVHTNTVENVWSLFKRSVMGSYHKLSAKHLDAYLDELEWRFNNRDNPYLFRDTLLKLIESDNLKYKELTS